MSFGAVNPLLLTELHEFKSEDRAGEVGSVRPPDRERHADRAAWRDDATRCRADRTA